MWHMYDGHHFWGMHLLWWLFWIIVTIWIFATPWEIPGQRAKRDTPLDILKKRLAKGEITKDEYNEIKKTLEKEQ
jgi:putative membrane protein